jgi:hypothetical protein
MKDGDGTLERLLAGADAEMARLAEGDVPTWQALFEHLLQKGQGGSALDAGASGPFVEAALEQVQGFEPWYRIAHTAASRCESDWFSTVMTALRPWHRWFFNGIARVRPADSDEMLTARLFALQNSIPEDALSQVRSLANDARRVWGNTGKLGQVLLLVHRRSSESGAHGDALLAAEEAERLFKAAGDDANVRFAGRLRAASLFCLRRFDDAFAVAEPLLGRPGPRFGGGGVFSLSVGSDERTKAAAEVAQVVGWATDSTPEWVRALGGLAERFAEPGLWRRFEAALTGMLQRSDDPEEDLEVVLRQADERGLHETVRVAVKIADGLGIRLDA